MQAYTAHQQPLNLGKILGQGGEGRVFALEEVEQQHAVKIYHQLPSPDKQAKLKAMVADNVAMLGKVALWPKQLVYNEHQKIIGFVMPRLPVGSVAIHHLYNPSQRKQDFPKADYAFLVHAARNLAAAFAYLHSCGHCVGDVNQGNVVVAPDATITLIDCDSFQINHQGQTFACEVGVAHFTPPELHGQPFAQVTKTPTHDNFGLAILIFHLLMMGRHPFAGVYLGEGEMPIEKAITEFRYAYSKNAQVKKIRPPPKAPSTAWLSDDIQELFEDAFDETIDKRPTAEQWLNALEKFGENLTRCHEVKIHKYYQGLLVCPWCEFEYLHKVYFFKPINNITGDKNNLVLMNEELIKIKNEIKDKLLSMVIYEPVFDFSNTKNQKKEEDINFLYSKHMCIGYAISFYYGILTLKFIFIFLPFIAVLCSAILNFLIIFLLERENVGSFFINTFFLFKRIFFRENNIKKKEVYFNQKSRVEYFANEVIKNHIKKIENINKDKDILLFLCRDNSFHNDIGELRVLIDELSRKSRYIEEEVLYFKMESEKLIEEWRVLNSCLYQDAYEYLHSGGQRMFEKKETEYNFCIINDNYEKEIVDGLFVVSFYFFFFAIVFFIGI